MQVIKVSSDSFLNIYRALHILQTFFPKLLPLKALSSTIYAGAHYMPQNTVCEYIL